MSKANIERQIKQIQEVQKSNLSYLDINYAGLDSKGFVLRYGSAILNQYKLWLQSSSQDYIRKPSFAGFFDNQLNRYPFNESSEETIKADLIAKTAEKFPNIEILSCIVKCMYSDRKWKINLTVKDKITGVVGQDDTGLEISVPA